MSKEYNNILVHSLVNIGDVLLSTSAVALLRQVYPNAKITMMVRPAAAQLVINNPVVDDVIIYDYKAKHKSFRSMWKMMQNIRSRRFDLCISFDRKLRPALLTWLAGIPVRVCPDRVFDDKPSRVTKLYTHVVKIQHDIINTLQAETYQAIIKGFTGTEGSARPVMARIMPEHEQKAEALINFLSVQPKSLLIALCVKGTFPLKDWPKERFAALVDRLAGQHDAAFFITGAPEDKEYADEVISLAKTPVVNFCGQTNLVELGALLKKTDIFITVDTGAAHIAATTGVPMVIMYGCTTPSRWKPLTDHVKVIAKNPGCAPCSVPADGCPKHACMSQISVEEMNRAVNQCIIDYVKS